MIVRLFAAIASLLLTASTFVPTEAMAAERPNVLLIMADDLRCDLGCYGHAVVRTPNLDRLAARGSVFDRAYCQQALCNPSRASMMTGKRPDTLGIWNLTVHFRERFPEIETLPRYFKQHGYFTQNIGKIYHNWRTEIQGDPSSWSVPAVMHFASHGDDRPMLPEGRALPDDTESHPRLERRAVEDEAYFDGRIAKLAVEALRERSKAPEPFLLAVGFWKPHLPFNPPARDWDQYQRSDIDRPHSTKPPQGVPPVALHDGRELLRSSEGREPNDDEVQALRHGYYAGISYLDRQVGKVLGELEKLGLAENTIVVFCSDHGFHLGEHSLWCKTSNFELDARVPMIISAPGIKPQKGKTEALVELLDVFPTVVDLAGLPAVNDLEGVSLKPLMEGSQKQVKEVAFTQHPRPAYYTGQTPEVMGYSARTPAGRYTEWRDTQTGKVVASELYDHRSDPHETVNRIDDVSNEALQRTAKKLLHAQFPLKP